MAFTLDVRSLALFRFLLGVAVCLDIINRFPEIQMDLTDGGWFPRQVPVRVARFDCSVQTGLRYAFEWEWSVYMLSGR